MGKKEKQPKPRNARRGKSKAWGSVGVHKWENGKISKKKKG